MGATSSKPSLRSRRVFRSKLKVIDEEKVAHLDNRGYELVHDFPVPQVLGPGEVMIRNCAAGLNHIDWKSLDYNFCLPELPWITGREMAGVVECVGSEVKRFRRGDRDPESMLVWGGSTVTGQFAIQMAVHAGLDVIAVCSDKTADLVRQLGPKHVVVYSGKSDDEVVSEIKALGQGRITKAVDLVGPKTSKLVLEAVSGDRVVGFAPLAFMKSGEIKPENVRVHNVEMKQFVLDSSSEQYAKRLGEMVEAGLVLPKLQVIDGGLAMVEQGG
ncbi:hypothetical protein OQA88_6069 [Cercophora sp. LCS_1]